MTLEIKIISVGKNKERWLQEALCEYEKRLFPKVKISWILTKTSQEFENICKEEKSYFCFDLQGKQLTSEEFSLELLGLWTKYHSRLTFVIGPAEGIPPFILKKAQNTYCLSKLTFTHQMVRLIFLEQIYRAIQIEQGSKYHK